MRKFLLRTHLFAFVIFLSVPIKSPLTFDIQITLCLNSLTCLDGYVAVKGSLGDEFYYKGFSPVKFITQVTVSKVFNSAM
jgi:hypothetical protein